MAGNAGIPSWLLPTLPTAPGRPPVAMTGAPPPEALAASIRPQPQGALNLPAGMGDYLYGAGNPADATPSLRTAALAVNARPPSQGVLNVEPPPMTAQGAPPTDADTQALGPENAAVLSRLLAKPVGDAPLQAKPPNLMLAEVLAALAPGASKTMPANQLNPAAPSPNPLVAALMAMGPGASVLPANG